MGLPHAHRLKRYNPLSCLSIGDVGSGLVSPPQTIKASPTRALAWPIRGLGADPVVCKRQAELSLVEKR